MERNYHAVGVVIDTEPEESNPFCSTCAVFGELSRLKQRLYLDDKGKALPRPPDADNWLQCWTCGLTIPTRYAKMLGKISGINGISPVENPYDFKKGKILGIDSKHRYQKLKQRKNKHEDKEVQKIIDQGWTVQDYKTSIPI